MDTEILLLANVLTLTVAFCVHSLTAVNCCLVETVIIIPVSQFRDPPKAEAHKCGSFTHLFLLPNETVYPHRDQNLTVHSDNPQLTKYMTRRLTYNG